MAVGREERRRTRESRVIAEFGASAPAALDLFEITELAWHDTYGEISPPEDLIDDLLLLSEGSLDRLVEFARLAIVDWRDVKVMADGKR